LEFYSIEFVEELDEVESQAHRICAKVLDLNSFELSWGNVSLSWTKLQSNLGSNTGPVRPHPGSI